MVRSALAAFLRYLATKIDGGESDIDLLARAYGVVRLPARSGSPEDIERVVRCMLPCRLEPVFEWSDDRRTMTMRLM